MAPVKIEPKRAKIKGLPKEVDLKEGATVAALTEALSKATGLSVNRLRLTIPGEVDSTGKSKKVRDTVLKSQDPVAKYVTAQSPVYVKDLGPQIGWKTVFFIEYAGPLFIHPFFYYCQSFVYGEKFPHTKSQYLVFLMFMIHFIKREYETAFVHHFSSATMPFFNVFKNSAHYWILAGIFSAYFSYAPQSWTSNPLFGREYIPWGDFVSMLIVGQWVFAELSNFKCHKIVSNLRADGSKDRKIPYGYGYDLVSMPNYFFESLGWFIVLVLIQNWSILVFFIVGTLQMWVWAKQKHVRYLKEFPDYPKNRKVMVPFLL